MPNSSLRTPEQLPTVSNKWTRATLDYRYSWSRHIAFGASYWYDAWRVDDFALSPQSVYGQRSLPDGLMLGYFWRPYTANTLHARVIYVW